MWTHWPRDITIAFAIYTGVIVVLCYAFGNPRDPDGHA